jgi:hypothetical protein
MRSPAPAGGELLAGGLDQTLVTGDERRGLEDLLGGVVGVPAALEGDRDGLEGRLDVGERRLAVGAGGSSAGGRTGGAPAPPVRTRTPG